VRFTTRRERASRIEAGRVSLKAESIEHGAQRSAHGRSRGSGISTAGSSPPAERPPYVGYADKGSERRKAL